MIVLAYTLVTKEIDNFLDISNFKQKFEIKY